MNTIIIEQIIGLDCANVIVTNEENKILESKEGIGIQKAFNWIDKFKKEHDVIKAIHIIFDRNKNEVSRTELSKDDF